MRGIYIGNMQPSGVYLDGKRVIKIYVDDKQVYTAEYTANNDE